MIENNSNSTPLSNSNFNWVEQLTQHFSKNVQTLQILYQTLAQENVIELDVKMGETTINPIHSNLAQNEQAFMEVVNKARLKLETLNTQRQLRDKRMFQFCMVTVGIALTLFLIGVIYFFSYPSDSRVGLFTSLSGIFPTFISGTAFWLYQRENEKTKAIEDDMRQLLRLESILGIIASLPDASIRQASYGKVFEQIKI